MAAGGEGLYNSFLHFIIYKLFSYILYKIHKKTENPPALYRKRDLVDLGKHKKQKQNRSMKSKVKNFLFLYNVM